MLRPPDQRPRRRASGVLAALCLLWILTEQPAYAYLDVGSISLVFQALIAAFFGALLVLKRYWGQVRHWLQQRFSSAPKDERG